MCEIFTLWRKEQRSREEEKEEERGQVRITFISPVLILVISARKSSFILYKIPKSWINPQQDISALQTPLWLYRDLHPSKLSEPDYFHAALLDRCWTTLLWKWHTHTGYFCIRAMMKWCRSFIPLINYKSPILNSTGDHFPKHIVTFKIDFSCSHFQVMKPQYENECETYSR